MWLSELYKGMKVTFMGIDNEWYSGTVRHWTHIIVKLELPNGDFVDTNIDRIMPVESEDLHA